MFDKIDIPVTFAISICTKTSGVLSISLFIFVTTFDIISFIGTILDFIKFISPYI